jgi:2'-5' RNA ligase
MTKIKHKYFIAIVFDSPLQDELTELKKIVEQQFNSKGALRSPAHITLQMPFDWEEKKVDRLHLQLAQFAATQKVFKIELKDFDYFEPRVVFVNVVSSENLQTLQSNLQTHLKLQLQLLETDGKLRGFHPHVTIGFRDLKKPQFFEAKTYFSERIFYSNVNCYCISLLKHDGLKWNVVKNFPFIDESKTES